MSPNSVVCPSRQNTRAILRAQVAFALIALCIPVLQFIFAESMTPREFLLQWLFSFVYSNCIGSLLMLLTPITFIATQNLSRWIRWPIRGLVIGALTCVGCLVAGILPVLLLHDSYWTNFRWSVKISLLISLIATIVVSSYEELNLRLKSTQLDLKTKELERERALKLASEARLASLESRIHPHFLFNTINSVSSLIHEDPDEAERLLIQMANLLRFSLDSAQTGLVPLDREMRVVADYLTIEKARFNGRLRYHLNVAEQLASVPVPPLSIQTLVENSIKYAIAPRREGGSIRVSAREQKTSVTLEVSDDGPGFSNRELPAGHGLSNLQERLHALYGDDALLDIGSAPNGSSVRLTIPVSR